MMITKSSDKEIENRIEKLERAINDAFPNGDARAHRLFHEALIEHAKWVRELKRDLISKAIYAALAIASGWVGIALWTAFKAEILK